MDIFSKNDDGSYTVGDFQIGADEMEVVYIGNDDLAVESLKGVVIALDTTITPELEIEGQARDLVRQIQELRKEADFNVSDRIEMAIKGCDAVIEKHADYIKSETLCVNLVNELSNPQIVKDVDIEGHSVNVSLKVVG